MTRPTTRTLCVTTLLVAATVGAGDAVGAAVSVGEAVGVSDGAGVVATSVGDAVLVGVAEGVGLDESDTASAAIGPDASAELARVVAEMIPAHSAMAVLAATTRAADVLI